MDDQHKEEFEDYVHDQFADFFYCYRSRELIQQGWYGLGEPDPKLLQRIGDYVLMGKNQTVIYDCVDPEKPWSLIGAHGGVSADEMYVPLITARC